MGGMDDWTEIESAADLTEHEAALVERAVRALVERDRAELEAMAAYEGGADPYLWTEGKQFVLPPGSVREWAVDGSRAADGPAVLDVDLWTAEDGKSDLTLSLEVTADGDVRIEGLHVL